MDVFYYTFTIATANEEGIKEKAILIIIAAENASKSYKIEIDFHHC